ncbi:MAG: 3',5'-cyclic-nucleotide phosphodiesterase [Gammaproteobacteria bacterium]|nr:3',5'-cyclic-nucleotide phosphodiesterase [Gammaproteobacteria bacterium]
MKKSTLHILGCSGGSGDNLFTTSFRLGDTILIDCGTGLGTLSAEAMLKIDHVFLTHSHQDHIALLPLFLERIYLARTQPVTLYARAETLAALKQHVFNWQIYPDFSELPLFEQQENPLVHFQELAEHEAIEIDGWHITGVPMDHTVPGLSYILARAGIRTAFTGDTRSLRHLAEAGPLDILICELSYPDHLEELAHISGHMTPSMLKRDLALFSPLPELWISHLKPQYAPELRRVIEPLLHTGRGMLLESGKRYTLARH